MTEITLGIVTDSHSGNFDREIVKALKEHQVDAVAFLGDACSGLRDERQKQGRQLVKTLLRYDQMGVPVFWIPGNYEDCQAYREAFDLLDEKKDRLEHVFDMSDKILESFKDYDLVFIPGAPNYTRGFGVANGYPTGDEKENESLHHIFNLRDLEKLIENPAKTIVFAHHPCSIQKSEAAMETGAIDLAVHAFYQGRLLVGPEAHEAIRRFGARPSLNHVGNKALTGLLKKMNIDKFFSGDIHEGTAIHDIAGNLIEEGEYSRQLFGNPGPAKEGNYGIVKLDSDGTAAMWRHNVTGKKRDYLTELLTNRILF